MQASYFVGDVVVLPQEVQFLVQEKELQCSDQLLTEIKTHFDEYSNGKAVSFFDSEQLQTVDSVMQALFGRFSGFGG